MKKLIYFLFILTTTVICISSKCDSPVVGDHSGAPGETTCSGCHSAPVNPDIPDMVFEVGNNESSYIPGYTYLVHIRIKRRGHNKFGFVCSSLDTLNTSKGTFSVIDAPRTRKYTLGGRNYFSHTPCGADAVDSTSWSFNWTAPTSNKGNIKLYMSMLVANHDEALTGDTTYTKVITLNPSTANGINEIGNAPYSNVYPSLFTNVINIEFDNRFEMGKKIILIFNQEGKIVETLSTNQQKIVFTPENISTAGLYFLQINCNGITQIKKIIKQ